MTPLFAEEMNLFGARFLEGFLHSAAFGLLGIALLLLAIKLFDWISPKIDLQNELTDKKNTAVAIVLGAMILGVSYIVATAIQ